MGMRRLQVLDLHRTAMGADGTAALAAVLPALAGSLMHLNLTDCSIDAKTAANALAPALAPAIALVRLCLYCNALGSRAAAWLVPVVSALPHLRAVGLYSCKLPSARR